MINGIDTRMVALELLQEILENKEYSHIAVGNALNKVQYLPKVERAFINRLVDGTVENQIRLDYIINQFSSVKTGKMKAVIRNILRMGVYQLVFMDSVPDSATCNEGVKLAQKKGFYNLKGFVNGVLRNIARKKEQIVYPDREKNAAEYLSVYYSMPLWIVERWMEEYGEETTEKILKAFLEEHPTTIRCLSWNTEQEGVLDSLREQGVTVKKAPYLPYAWYISDYGHLAGLEAFARGKIVVQDVSSMLAGEIAHPAPGDKVIDLCAAPGGKSIHVADQLKGTGQVESRDLSDYKVDLIRENIERTGLKNIKAVRRDATVMEKEDVGTADLILADLPCSGLGVIGRKSDIKYRIDPDKISELAQLQKTILHNAASYVKPGGTLIYSTCTITKEENVDNLKWFLENYPYELESLDPYLDEKLQSETTRQGYLQLLPGIHQADGFFMARLIRKQE